MRQIVNEQIERWDYHQKREALGRPGVRIYVAREGTGRGSFTIEVAPPWPEGTEQWAGLFGGTVPLRRFEFTPDGTGVTALSKSVYAAFKRTQSLAKEGE